jgi:hypothetical protein
MVWKNSAPIMTEANVTITQWSRHPHIDPIEIAS